MDKKKILMRALPVLLVLLVILVLALVRKGTGDTRIITVKVMYQGQVEKAYELNTPEHFLGAALLEVPDGQDFSTVQEIYVNGVLTEIPLSDVPVQEGDLFELVYGETQLGE